MLNRPQSQAEDDQKNETIQQFKRLASIDNPENTTNPAMLSEHQARALKRT